LTGSYDKVLLLHFNLDNNDRIANVFDDFQHDEEFASKLLKRTLTANTSAFINNQLTVDGRAATLVNLTFKLEEGTVAKHQEIVEAIATKIGPCKGKIKIYVEAHGTPVEGFVGLAYKKGLRTSRIAEVIKTLCPPEGVTYLKVFLMACKSGASGTFDGFFGELAQSYPGAICSVAASTENVKMPTDKKGTEKSGFSYTMKKDVKLNSKKRLVALPERYWIRAKEILESYRQEAEIVAKHGDLFIELAELGRSNGDHKGLGSYEKMLSGIIGKVDARIASESPGLKDGTHHYRINQIMNPHPRRVLQFLNEVKDLFLSIQVALNS
jgi:hypothetical protein